MTTIAANRKCMAGDSRVSDGSTFYHTDKIFHIGDSIVGIAGNVQNTTKFLAWFRKECPPDETGMTIDDDHEFAALVLNPRGLFYYADVVEPDRIKDKYFAIGSGADIALTAMDCGKSPTEAVKHACRRNSDTGGDVKTLTLHISKKRKPKTAMAPRDAQTDTPSAKEGA